MKDRKKKREKCSPVESRKKIYTGMGGLWGWEVKKARSVHGAFGKRGWSNVVARRRERGPEGAETGRWEKMEH